MRGFSLRVLLGVLACTVACSTLERRVLPPLPKDSELHWPSLTHFCTAITSKQQWVRVQVLIDSSGSMNGFQASIPRLDVWTRQGISQAQGMPFELGGLRRCYFSQGKGIYGCVEGNNPRAPFRASGNTNLHEAINSAYNYDLTVILTDGVAATGSGAGDCAMGVDAACVGRALRNAVTTLPGQAKETQPGFWIIPIVALFDGLLFTEESIAPAAFDSAVAADNVQADTRTVAKIQNPRTGAGGQLIYSYHGPRLMLALVIAHNEDLGRALVQGIVARAQAPEVQRLSELSEFQQGIGVLPPIEIYPGYVPPVDWLQLREYEVKNQPQILGTVGHRWESPGTLRLECPDSGPNEAQYYLEANPPTGRSGCMELYVLPGVRFEHQTARSEDVVKDFSWRINEPQEPVLYLHLGCGKEFPASCQASVASQSHINFLARPDYRESANALATKEPSGAGARLLLDLSASQASLYPHRVYGLKETIEKFYNEVSAVSPLLPFARLNVCKDQK